VVKQTLSRLLCSYRDISCRCGLKERATHLSRNSWNRKERVSPVTSTTLGTSKRAPPALLPTLEPTTSSSGKPSTSLFAPALSEGGARGREEERYWERLGAPASLEGVGAASDCSAASSSEDMATLDLTRVLVCEGVVDEGVDLTAGKTRRFGRAAPC
jgi:hypothetical protein